MSDDADPIAMVGDDGTMTLVLPKNANDREVMEAVSAQVHSAVEERYGEKYGVDYKTSVDEDDETEEHSITLRAGLSRGADLDFKYEPSAYGKIEVSSMDNTKLEAIIMGCVAIPAAIVGAIVVAGGVALLTGWLVGAVLLIGGLVGLVIGAVVGAIVSQLVVSVTVPKPVREQNEKLAAELLAMAQQIGEQVIADWAVPVDAVPPPGQPPELPDNGADF